MFLWSWRRWSAVVAAVTLVLLLGMNMQRPMPRPRAPLPAPLQVVNIKNNSNVTVNTNRVNTNVISNTNTTVKISTNKSSSKPPVKADPKVVLTKSLYEAGHSVPHPEICPHLGQYISVVILITSAPSHSLQRQAIRLTWGHYGARRDVAMAFVLGAPQQDLRAALESEDTLYGDLIIGNSVDSYSNLTLKSLSLLEWAATYCPRANKILKTDDDMFINVPKLLQFVQQRKDHVNTIWGKVLHKAYPKRTPHAKYYLSPVQFPARVLPDFATGPAYLLTADCVTRLLARAPDQPYVRLEDVFITGILSLKAGIKRINAPQFINRRANSAPCTVQRNIALHMIRYHEQFDLWRKLLDGKSKCS